MTGRDRARPSVTRTNGRASNSTDTRARANSRARAQVPALLLSAALFGGRFSPPMLAGMAASLAGGYLYAVAVAAPAPAPAKTQPPPPPRSRPRPVAD